MIFFINKNWIAKIESTVLDNKTAGLKKPGSYVLTHNRFQNIWF